MGAATSACAVGASIGLTVFVPFYYQLVHKLSVSESGLALIPIAVMTTPGSIMVGRAMMYLRHYKRVPYRLHGAGDPRRRRAWRCGRPRRPGW